MRFAGMLTRNRAATARLRDLSETGLAFVLENSDFTKHIHGLPDEGDMIKIEFTVPGRKQIACFGTVVRVEARTEWSPEFGDQPFLLIAVQFRNLPTLHLRAIQLGLQGRVAPDEQVINRFAWTTEFWYGSRQRHLISFAGLSVVLVLVFWMAVQSPYQWLALIRNMMGF
jgi:hypothetical protein